MPDHDPISFANIPTAAPITASRVRTAAPAAAILDRAAAFRALLAVADRAAHHHAGVVPSHLEQRILARFHGLVADLHRVLDAEDARREVRGDLGRRVQEVALPGMRLSELGARMYDKPRGYAGDFLTISLMYRGTPSGNGPVGTILDKALRLQPACKAVVHRRGLMAEEIIRTLATTEGRPARVTSLACGPATELFDVFAGLRDPQRLGATCIDIDDQALGYVADRRGAADLDDEITLHQGNLVHLAFGRRKLDLAPQDLMYSIGLIDYFSDKFVVRLLDWIHGILRPGGRVILGNFHPANPSRALMEHVFEWNLIHRSEADMHRLFAASRFGRGCTSIRFEGEGVNLFAECVKR